jgi:hypothetical protein
LGDGLWHTLRDGDITPPRLPSPGSTDKARILRR